MFAQAKKVNLIILGSHGRTGLRKLLMGSVAERVIGQAHCPVLVVKKK
jgi:nucleotide-binding universal stress UspA family protein